jgi:Adenylate cyclase regulatory domain
VATAGEQQPRRDVTSDAGIEALLDGLDGEARRDRAELIIWLLDRGFTVDQIGAALTPMMLPANRVMGDDGIYASTREMSRLTGIDLELLQADARRWSSLSASPNSARCFRQNSLKVSPASWPSSPTTSPSRRCGSSRQLVMR